MTKGKFLTVKEVADIMRVDVQTVRAWIKAKKLPAEKKYGRKWLVYSLDIPTYARRND